MPSRHSLSKARSGKYSEIHAKAVCFCPLNPRKLVLGLLQIMLNQSTQISTEFQYLGDISELEPHGQFSKWLDDHDILVYRYEGEVRALSNICPHFGGPVGYHKMREGGKFVCLWHSYEFSAKDGKCTSHGSLKLREYKVKTEGNRIFVQLVEKG